MRYFAALIALLIAAPGQAQERIDSYDIRVDVQKDGALDVTERIAVHAEGQQIRRGIYRDFPTRYADRFNNRVVVGLKVLGVERNGVTEPWFTENKPNGIRINTGNDDFLPVPADYTYTLRYRTTRQLGFFSDHDELYWNAIGTGWIFPILRGTVEVHLPSPVPVDQMHVEAYTGVQGAKGSTYVAEIPGPGVARFRLTEPLNPYEAFTIVVTFPKGLVPAPTSADKARFLLSDNQGVLIAVAGLIAMLLYMFRTWSQVGRDPAKGIVIARYEPRDDQTPAGLRYVQRMGYDMRCFTADVLALAVAGRVHIRQEKALFKDQWSLERVDSPPSTPISPAQHMLYEMLFRKGDVLVLKNTNATRMQAASNGHKGILKEEAEPRYFKRNAAKVAIAFVIGAIAVAIAFALSHGFGIPLIIGTAAIMLVSLVTFGALVRAPTLEGRKVLDEIEGLKLYMSVAEREELKSMRGPDEPVLDAKRYEAMLPFAVALGVEDAWTKKFTLAAGAAAAAQAANSMVWYSGRGPISSLGDFTHSISSSLNSSISSASTPPGSSSGAGGGGSAGGGGGGGGGGGR
ncbi:MAG TPA: DUF2207 domain-containing protein [Gemmatimonadaceae bacterium]|nr:DUF2207 domain-containing protein [Gemmatimonadaceae bacterium]